MIGVMVVAALLAAALWWRPGRGWVAVVAAGSASATTLWPTVLFAGAVAGVVWLNVTTWRRGVASAAGGMAACASWSAEPLIPILPAVLPWVAVVVVLWPHRKRFAVAAGCVAAVGLAWSWVSVRSQWTGVDRSGPLRETALEVADLMETVDKTPLMRAASVLPGFSDLVQPWDELYSSTRPAFELLSGLNDSGLPDAKEAVEVADSVKRSVDALDSWVDDPHWGWLIERSRLSEQVARLDTARQAAQTLVGLAAVQQQLDTGAQMLVLALNPAEARATSGIPGGFGTLAWNGNEWVLTTAGRVEGLNVALAGRGDVSSLPEFESEFARFGVAEDWRNVTMSPDAVMSASAALVLAEQSALVDIGAVALVDPVVLAAVMDVLDLEVYAGRSRIDGAALVEFVSNGQYKEFEASSQLQRDLVLVNLIASMFREVTDKFDWGQMSMSALGRLGDALATGHLTVVSADVEVDAELSGAAWLRGFDRRSLHEGFDVVRFGWSNAAANKLDWFADVDVEAAFNGSSDVATVTAVIAVEDVTGEPQWVRGLPGGLVPPGMWRGWVTLHTSRPVEAVLVDGVQVAVDRWDGDGVGSSGLVVEVSPGSSSTVEFRLGPGSGCHGVDLWRQPALPGRHRVTWNVAGRSGVVETVREKVPYPLASGQACRTVPG